jgi:ankyrin repeat protein
MPVVKFLISERVNLDKIDSTGVSPLYHAIMKGHEDIASLLYMKGASVHAPPKNWPNYFVFVDSRVTY